MTRGALPLPPHFRSDSVGTVWRVPYEERAAAAADWARQYGLGPAAQDSRKIVLLAIDVQNTFCIPGFELYVGGRSGTGAVDDNRRLCEFIYRNLGRLTRIVTTMDTHRAIQIFHGAFLIDAEGRHPPPFSLIGAEDVAAGHWRVNPAAAAQLVHVLGIEDAAGNGGEGIDTADLQRHLAHYTETLARAGKYALTIWPYHSMLGGIGHALVAAVEEAIFFHGLARESQAEFYLKGSHPLTEHYSALGPEVNTDPDGHALVPRHGGFVDMVEHYDAVVIAGQAKSHCVAWTVADLLAELTARDPALAGKIYLLEDCTSSVVIPGIVDYTEEADEAFCRFSKAGAHVVRSAEPMVGWPGLDG